MVSDRNTIFLYSHIRQNPDPGGNVYLMNQTNIKYFNKRALNEHSFYVLLYNFLHAVSEMFQVNCS